MVAQVTAACASLADESFGVCKSSCSPRKQQIADLFSIEPPVLLAEHRMAAAILPAGAGKKLTSECFVLLAVARTMMNVFTHSCDSVDSRIIDALGCR